jgi:hypothetical protein
MTYSSNTILIYQNVSYFRYPILRVEALKMHVLCAFNDHESQRIIGTYTAYNGHTILPNWSLLKILYLSCNAYMELVLKIKPGIIPRKIRASALWIDGVNNYLMFSDKLTQQSRCTSGTLSMGTNWELRISALDWGRLVSHHPRCRGHETVLPTLYLILMTLQRKLADSKIPYFRHVKRNEKVMYHVVYSCGSIIHNNSLILC